MEKLRAFLRRFWWLIALALLLLALVTATLIFLVGSRGVSADADKAHAILAAYDADAFPGASLREDGTLEMDLGKADLYRFAADHALSGQVRAWLQRDERLLSAGFRISGGALTISLTRRAGGFLPLSYRATAGARLEGMRLVVEVSEVKLGSRITLSESRWPAVLRQGLVVDLSGTDFAGELLSAELMGSELNVRLRGLTAPRSGILTLDKELAAGLRCFGLSPETLELFSAEGTVTAEELCAAAIASGDAADYLAEAMSLCEKEGIAVLWRGSSTIEGLWLWGPLRQETAERREALEAALTERQYPYEKLLLAVRELYRSNALGILETGFYNPATGESVHAGTLSRLEVTAIDSRLVFLVNAEGEAAPEDMPALLDVPRKNWLSMDKDMDWKASVDMGVLLTTEGGVPILLYRRADGALVLREVTEELYVSAMVSRTTPQLDMQSLPPMTVYERSAGEGYSGAVIGLLTEE